LDRKRHSKGFLFIDSLNIQVLKKSIKDYFLNGIFLHRNVSDFHSVNGVPLNDICLMITSRQIAFDDVTTKPMNQTGDSWACGVGQYCTVSGWGRLSVGVKY
jgi:hypothetical protein